MLAVLAARDGWRGHSCPTPETLYLDDPAPEIDGAGEGTTVLEHGMRSLVEVQTGLKRCRPGVARHGSFE